MVYSVRVLRYMALQTSQLQMSQAVNLQWLKELFDNKHKESALIWTPLTLNSEGCRESVFLIIRTFFVKFRKSRTMFVQYAWIIFQRKRVIFVSLKIWNKKRILNVSSRCEAWTAKKPCIGNYHWILALCFITRIPYYRHWISFCLLCTKLNCYL